MVKYSFAVHVSFYPFPFVFITWGKFHDPHTTLHIMNHVSRVSRIVKIISSPLAMSLILVKLSLITCIKRNILRWCFYWYNLNSISVSNFFLKLNNNSINTLGLAIIHRTIWKLQAFKILFFLFRKLLHVIKYLNF